MGFYSVRVKPRSNNVKTCSQYYNCPMYCKEAHTTTFLKSFMTNVGFTYTVCRWLVMIEQLDSQPRVHHCG